MMAEDTVVNKVEPAGTNVEQNSVLNDGPEVPGTVTVNQPADHYEVGNKDRIEERLKGSNLRETDLYKTVFPQVKSLLDESSEFQEVFALATKDAIAASTPKMAMDLIKKALVFDRPKQTELKTNVDVQKIAKDIAQEQFGKFKKVK